MKPSKCFHTHACTRAHTHTHTHTCTRVCCSSKGFTTVKAPLESVLAPERNRVGCLPSSARKSKVFMLLWTKSPFWEQFQRADPEVQWQVKAFLFWNTSKKRCVERLQLLGCWKGGEHLYCNPVETETNVDSRRARWWDSAQTGRWRWEVCIHEVTVHFCWHNKDKQTHSIFWQACLCIGGPWYAEVRTRIHEWDVARCTSASWNSNSRSLNRSF